MNASKENKWAIKNWMIELFLYLVIVGVLSFGDPEVLYSTWQKNLISLALIAVLYAHAMIHRLWLFPILFDQNQKIKYFSLAILFLIIFSSITYKLELYYLTETPEEIAKEIENLKKIMANKTSYFTFWSDMFLNIFVVLFFCSSYFISRHFEQEKKRKEIKLLVNQLEINQLREQLNPHFMFNTLNNLYGISLEQPERTPDLILKLSQMMRYQIEAIKKEYVPLYEEINFIESFIAIENERVNTRCVLKFEQKITTNDLQIAPILLLPFIENAFKHATTSSEKSFITINIKLSNDAKLHLEVQNSIPSKTKASHSTGVGLENVKQRLTRLYPEKYQLEINSEKSIFKVNLSIKLND